ncbi:(d)CMP kinase [Salinibacter altiplanensis]|uniref:(d)CMP kinase n=1 Tax=Salinibacter altiplanensis TaxID=1803181 RepID=UPI000C9F894C|nr:(d)CMP kinase [Salinibacter altiplanensis]
MIVTIDGPAGSGKSTTARRAAARLNYVYLDTGAMYRAVALGFLRADAPATLASAETVLSSLRVDVRYRDGTMQVFLGDEAVTDRLRSAEVGRIVSDISTLEPIREYMVEQQRRIGHAQADRHGGVVLDGRDTGTVVFPEAPVKIFMVADIDERARRRLQEHEAAGEEITFEEVRAEIEQRDEQDRTRDIAPLRRADDATVLDTTDCTIAEQVDLVVDHVKAQDAHGT